jgi:hypothetical protein
VRGLAFDEEEEEEEEDADEDDVEDLFAARELYKYTCT